MTELNEHEPSRRKGAVSSSTKIALALLGGLVAIALVIAQTLRPRGEHALEGSERSAPGNGWSAEAICEAEYEGLLDINRTYGQFGLIIEGVKRTGVGRAIKGCAEEIRLGVVACSEYKFGSDRGEDCMERRIGAVARDYYIRLASRPIYSADDLAWGSGKPAANGPNYAQHGDNPCKLLMNGVSTLMDKVATCIRPAVEQGDPAATEALKTIRDMLDNPNHDRCQRFLTVCPREAEAHARQLFESIQKVSPCVVNGDPLKSAMRYMIEVMASLRSEHESGFWNVDAWCPVPAKSPSLKAVPELQRNR